ncbi:myristoyl transferase, partial [Pseudoflavonifractor phocaeensis]|nr:myristoyl transferase [Pseudoflavonifractor phocaeensis]
MKRFYLAAIAMALLLSACGGPAAEVTPTLSPAAEPTAAPVST